MRLFMRLESFCRKLLLDFVDIVEDAVEEVLARVGLMRAVRDVVRDAGGVFSARHWDAIAAAAEAESRREVKTRLDCLDFLKIDGCGSRTRST